MKILLILYRIILVCLFGIFSLQSNAQFKIPVRKDVSLGGKLVDVQKRFTAYINKTKNPNLITARQLSLEGMRLKDKLDNRAAIINYLKAEILLSQTIANQNLKDLLLADILQNKGRAYHYLGNGGLARDFVNDSKRINEALINNSNIEIAQFAYFFLATNYDMLEGIMPIHFNTSGKPYAIAAVKIKRNILKIRGAEMGRSYWNYAVHFQGLPKQVKPALDTMLIYSRLAEDEFALDNRIDRVYTAEFISSNRRMLAERYMNVYHNIDSCKFYSEKIIASLAINNRYKFPDKLPAFLNYEELIRSSPSLSVCMAFIYENTHDKRYIEIAKSLLDSASKALYTHTAETFIQGNRNISTMNYTNKFVINTLAAGESFPMKNEKCFEFLAEIEKVKTYNYQKKLLENEIAHSSENTGREIATIRKLNSQYDKIEAGRFSVNHVDYLVQNLTILSKIDSLEKSNYKKEIVENIFYSDDKTKIHELCNQIAPTTTVLIYYCDDLVNLCASVSSAGVAIYKIPIGDGFINDLVLFKSLTANQTMLDINWCNLSNKVYNHLVKPYISNLNTKDLVIITSGILNCIPFESLVTSFSKKNNTVTDVNYLMQSVNIRYEYSLKSLYLKNVLKQTNSKGNVFAFAPKYEIPDSLKKEIAFATDRNFVKSNIRSGAFPLKYNVPEAQMVARDLNGIAFVNNDATEEKFREVALKGDILHLAMHSYSFNEDPMYWGLVFAKNKSHQGSLKGNINNGTWIDDDVLYAYEIYEMNLKSDLIVLSACETGMGEYANGEGTRSLGLAFRYAGCNNTVMSLWAVDDEYTGELMSLFYKYISTGKPKAEALTLAKKDFVNKYNSAGPFYWAGFILYGDNKPVHLKKQSNFILLFSIGLILILLIGFALTHRTIPKYFKAST